MEQYWNPNIPDIWKTAFTNDDIGMAEYQDIYTKVGPERYEQFSLHWSPDRHKMAIQEIEEVSQGNKNVHILDAGAGTGLVGQELFNLGYRHMDALEPNSDLLEYAKKRNIYKNLFSELLGPNKLSIDDKSYDILISVGAFTKGHANETCFDELIRITKKGGYVIIITGEDYIINQKGMANFEPTIKKYESDGHWKASRKVIPGYSNFCIPGNGIVYKMQII